VWKNLHCEDEESGASLASLEAVGRPSVDVCFVRVGDGDVFSLVSRVAELAGTKLNGRPLG
jgi:hypothetical protein